MSTPIENRFTWPVIEADNRDANVSWQHHLQRGSAGGVDLAYPYATPVWSPANGTLVNDADPDGSGGRMGILYVDHPELARIEFLHLSLNAPAGGKGIGTSLGLSGASGFGQDWYYARHLHVHAYHRDGRRVNLWNYFSAPAPAGGGTTPIPTLEENDMLSFIPDASNATIWLHNNDTGKYVGIGSPYHVTLLDRAQKNRGGDKMLRAELDIVASYQRAVSEDDVNVAAIIAEINKVAVKPEQVAAAIKTAGITIDANVSADDVSRIAKALAAELPQSAVTPEVIEAAVKGALHDGVTVSATVPDEQLDAAAFRIAKLIGIRLAGGDIAGA